MADIVKVDKEAGNSMLAIVSASDKSNLTEIQQNNVARAFSTGAYDMACEYIWKISMSKIKESMANLGTDFIADMLNRTDIQSYMSVDSILTDYSAIELAERLGMINTLGAMELHSAYELVHYFFSSKAQEEGTSLNQFQTIQIISACVNHILNVKDLKADSKILDLRTDFLQKDFTRDDPLLQTLSNSHLYYVRTFITILINAIRSSTGAELTHAVHNFLTLLPLVWGKIKSSDKWNIGQFYAEMEDAGKEEAYKGVMKALIKVNGFDYVPETLRSRTFINAANNLINVHFNFNNFYFEGAAIKSLASLGTSIPNPAFNVCVKAYLLCFIGNTYGISFASAPIAEEQLTKLTQEDWKKYFDEVLPYDEEMIGSIYGTKPVDRFSSLIQELHLNEIDINNDFSQKMIAAVFHRSYATVDDLRHAMLKEIKKD